MKITLKKNFTYSYYSTTTVCKGAVLYNGSRRPGQLLSDNSWLIVLGHGANEVIPASYLTITNLDNEINYRHSDPRGRDAFFVYRKTKSAVSAADFMAGWNAAKGKLV